MCLHTHTHTHTQEHALVLKKAGSAHPYILKKQMNILYKQDKRKPDRPVTSV